MAGENCLVLVANIIQAPAVVPLRHVRTSLMGKRARSLLSAAQCLGSTPALSKWLLPTRRTHTYMVTLT